MDRSDSPPSLTGDIGLGSTDDLRQSSVHCVALKADDEPVNIKLNLGAIAVTVAGVVIGWAGTPTPLHIATNSAQVCGDTLVLVYSQERLVGKEWTPQQDQTRVKAQVHGINGRYQPGGAWIDAPSVSGGEGRLRVSVRYVTERGVVFDKVRVVLVDSRVASSAKVPDWLCGQPASGRIPSPSPTPSPSASVAEM